MLQLVSLLASNSLPTYRGVAGYLSRSAGVRVELIEGVPWTEQEHMIDRGAADLGAMCGLLYTRKTDWLELLAAPVPTPARYQGWPIYFSNIVVPRGSRFETFGDLRGARWLYNDRGSFSGYAVLRAHLAALGESGAFCGSIAESGGHLRSIKLLAAGLADAAAIDSTVLDLELWRRPALAEQIRIVATLGPHAIPPLVVARRLPAEQKEALRAALLRMHHDLAGRAALADGLFERFAAVQDADYDGVRATARRAEQVVW